MAGTGRRVYVRNHTIRQRGGPAREFKFAAVSGCISGGKWQAGNHGAATCLPHDITGSVIWRGPAMEPLIVRQLFFAHKKCVEKRILYTCLNGAAGTASAVEGGPGRMIGLNPARFQTSTFTRKCVNMAETAQAPIEQSAEQEPPKLRHINQIKMDLAKRLPDDMLRTREQGGKTITYIPWYHATRMLDRFAPGWSTEIRSTQVVADAFVIVIRLTIPTSEGSVSFEATGLEDLKSKGYGDFASNASSMALRRCAAQAGLGRYLYYTK